MTISRRLRHYLLTQLPAAEREALALELLELLELPRIPPPIAGGGALMEGAHKKSALGGSTVTLVPEPLFGDFHPLHLKWTQLVVTTPSTPAAEAWGTVVNDGKKHYVSIGVMT
jgi:hypothetical protein